MLLNYKHQLIGKGNYTNTSKKEMFSVRMCTVKKARTNVDIWRSILCNLLISKYVVAESLL